MITAYLDSNDYSRLGQRRDTDLAEIWRRLESAAESGRARFVFSAAHLSEMAPTELAYLSSAEDRTDALVALCKRNALISFDRLIEQELTRLARVDAPEVQAFSEDGTWFPEVGADLLKPVDLAGMIRDKIGIAFDQGMLSSDQRELAERTMFSDGRLNPELIALLRTTAAGSELDRILEQLPMRPENMQVMWEYVLGNATQAEAEAAFLESLRDPRWMMRWFEQHYEKMSQLSRWFRRPAENMVRTLEEVVAKAQAIPAEQFKHEFPRLEEGMLLGVANEVLHEAHPHAPACTRFEYVCERSPGLATTLHVTMDIMKDALTARPRQLKRSDFLDAVHAMYAPYVDVFRADTYMATKIAPHVRTYGTTVVSRLEEMPSVLGNLMAGLDEGVGV